MTRQKQHSIDSVTEWRMKIHRNGVITGVLWSSLAWMLLILILLVSTAAKAQDAEIKILKAPAASGRLLLSVNGSTGWWWPGPVAKEMLGDIEAGRECSGVLVPAIQAKLDIREWQLARYADLDAKAAELDDIRKAMDEAKTKALRSATEKLLKSRRSLGIGVLVGMGTAAVVFATAAFASK